MTSIAIASLFLVAPNSQATTPQSILTTCTDLNNHKTSALKATQKRCNPFLAPATWHLQQSDSAAHSGAGFATLRICSSKNPAFTYQFIKSSCPKYQVTRDYWRSIATPGIPLIASISARGYDSAVFTLSPMIETLDAPIAYYLVTNIKTGQVNKLAPNNLSQLSLANLNALTSYTFQIAAVSVDGISRYSSITPVITTGAVPVVVVAPVVPALATPAFTLSAASETRTVNTVATGFTTSSTGGAIASFAIAPAAPAGMSFSTTTGSFTGTPTTVAGATTYTITATNAAGSATRTFTLTVKALGVGDRGPGGGIIFYYSPIAFTETGTTCDSSCHYLEAAPTSGTNGWTDATYAWSGNVNVAIGTSGTAIGTGYANTLAIVQQADGGTAADKAGTKSRAYGGPNNLTDWFLPSKDELNQMCKWARGVAWISDATVCTGGAINTGSGASGFVEDFYWSSSEFDASNAWVQGLTRLWVQGFSTKNSGGFYVRPIRVF